MTDKLDARDTSALVQLAIMTGMILKVASE
jgi:hypothetical protein